MVITKANQPMGFEEAIQAEFKKQGLAQGIEQGIEIGEAKRDEELLKNAVPELMQEGFSATPHFVGARRSQILAPTFD